MKIIISDSYRKSCEVVVDKVVDLINKKPNAKLGLATGGTAEAIYELMVKAYEEKRVSFAKVSSVNLDEYAGLSPDSSQSYRTFMNERLFDKVDIDKKNTFVANGTLPIEEAIAQFNEKLYSDKNNVDFQVLGVGVSGHIGFNEPANQLHAGVHLEGLNESTIEANSRFFDNANDVPKHAITMGMGDILKAKEIVLVATGSAKAPAIKKLLCDDMVDPLCPVTFLKLHPNTTIFIDNELAEMIGYK